MGLFDNKTKSSSQLLPWKPAMPGMEAAMDIGMAGLENPWSVYGGDLVAGLNPFQQAALGGMGGWGAGRGGNLADLAAATGAAGLSGAAGGYGDVMGALSGGAPQMGELNFDYAGRVADNPYMSSMIDAALRDSTRQLTEQTLPGIRGSAAASGNAASSRRGAAEAIAERGYMDRAADVGAQMRGGAYGQGLNIAQQQAAANPQLQFQGLNTMLNAAGGLSGLGQFGLGQGYGMGLQNLQTQLGAGEYMQGQQQREIDAAMAQHYLGQQLPFQQAQMGLGIYSPLAQTFGKQKNQQTQSMGLGNVAASIAGQALGGAMMGGMNPFGAIGGALGGLFGGGAPTPTTPAAGTWAMPQPAFGSFWRG